MKKAFIYLAIAAFSFSGMALANDSGAKKLLGIIALHQLCYWTCDGYDQPLPLYYETDLNTTPATFLLHEDIENWPEFEEYDYEASGATVYETKNNWYRISRNDELLWAHQNDTGDYHPYPQILEDRLSFYTGESKQIWKDMSQSPETLNHDFGRKYQGQIPINIKKISSINGMWWLNVEVLEESPCVSEKETVIHSGWMPAYDDQNKVQFWFYSRGC